MTKREFYLIAIIVIFTYLAIIFQVNLNNFVAAESGNENNFIFNAFELAK